MLVLCVLDREQDRLFLTTPSGRILRICRVQNSQILGGQSGLPVEELMSARRDVPGTITLAWKRGQLPTLQIPVEHNRGGGSAPHVVRLVVV